MASSLQDSLGQGHLVAGKVTASAGTAAVLTSNDGSATLTRVAAGEYTVTFGDAFLTAPVVTGTSLKAFGTATTSTDVVVVMIEAVSTSAVTFNLFDVVGVATATTGDQSDAADFHFVAFGLRNN